MSVDRSRCRQYFRGMQTTIADHRMVLLGSQGRLLERPLVHIHLDSFRSVRSHLVALLGDLAHSASSFHCYCHRQRPRHLRSLRGLKRNHLVRMLALLSLDKSSSPVHEEEDW